jgi:hypothetical protein
MLYISWLVSLMPAMQEVVAVEGVAGGANAVGFVGYGYSCHQRGCRI